MISFYPEFLNQIKEQLEKELPSPSDFATKEDTFVYELLAKMRNENISFLELSVNNINYSYQFSKFCSDQEFEQLKIVFKSRITSFLFDIGWIYCQSNPDNLKAIILFTDACQWMKEKKAEVYNKTLIGRTGLPWEDIYLHSVDIMRVEKLSLENFCEKFNILKNTLFYTQLQLVYFSRCEKDELLENEALLTQLISASNLEFLRPAIKNYTAKVRFDEISQLVSDALSFRLSTESENETLGLSPNMLQRIRKQKYYTILEDCANRNSKKLSIYQSIAGMIKNVELLTKGFFAIDFGIYVVIDNTDWETHAFAYIPQIYAPLSETWKTKEYPDDYWPAMNDADISNAREVILGLKKAGVIRLGFTDFEMLYTKDLLTINRY